MGDKMSILLRWIKNKYRWDFKCSVSNPLEKQGFNFEVTVFVWQFDFFVYKAILCDIVNANLWYFLVIPLVLTLFSNGLELAFHSKVFTRIFLLPFSKVMFACLRIRLWYFLVLPLFLTLFSNGLELAFHSKVFTRIFLLPFSKVMFACLRIRWHLRRSSHSTLKIPAAHLWSSHQVGDTWCYVEMIPLEDALEFKSKCDQNFVSMVQCRCTHHATQGVASSGSASCCNVSKISALKHTFDFVFWVFMFLRQERSILVWYDTSRRLDSALFCHSGEAATTETDPGNVHLRTFLENTFPFWPAFWSKPEVVHTVGLGW